MIWVLVLLVCWPLAGVLFLLWVRDHLWFEDTDEWIPPSHVRLVGTPYDWQQEP